MISSKTIRGAWAGLAALAIAGTAIAQSTPPNPAAKDPAVGAGQQSSQSTPMGSTGTPAGGSTPSGSTGAAGSTGSGSTSADTGSTGAGSTMGASGASDTTTRRGTTRTARADRN